MTAKAFSRLLAVLAEIVSFAAFLAAQDARESTLPALEQQILKFEVRGSFDEILRRLALDIRSTGVIGFERIPNSSQRITISAQNATAREIMTRLCAEDHNYVFGEAADPRMINVVPTTSSADLDQLLQMPITRFDMVVDKWPREWFMSIPDFSPDIRAYLQKYYRTHLHPHVPNGSPGSHMETNVRPPHLELHMTNVRVREILNALAVKSLDWASGKDAPIPVGITPYPEGWKCELPDTNTPYWLWIRSVFSSFP